MIYVVIAWAGAVAWVDWRQHRVPNLLLVLLLVPAVLGLAVNRQGLLGVGVASSLLGMLAAGAILLPGYALGKMGAGDVKFAACLGLLLGWLPLLKALLIFGLVLGAVSAVVLWHDGNSPDKGKRRIAVAPAMVVGFVSQLFMDRLPLNFLG